MTQNASLNMKPYSLVPPYKSQKRGTVSRAVPPFSSARGLSLVAGFGIHPCVARKKRKGIASHGLQTPFVESSSYLLYLLYLFLLCLFFNIFPSRFCCPLFTIYILLNDPCPQGRTCLSPYPLSPPPAIASCIGFSTHSSIARHVSKDFARWRRLVFLLLLLALQPVCFVFTVAQHHPARFFGASAVGISSCFVIFMPNRQQSSTSRRIHQAPAAHTL